MPRSQRDCFGSQVPLPEGWDVERDVDGKPFYIDHNTKQTTWVDPRDRLTKPGSFSDCLGDELPYGWEQTCDPKLGTYFINHLTKTNQIEDPRLKWREEQEKMLREYLADANQDLIAKKQIFTVKNERLTLANEEVQNLTDKLANWKASGTSLNSTSSSSSTKYDPDLLRADIADARNRVSRLKQELEHIRASMQYTERGLETLKQVNDKMVENQNIYDIEEAQAVLGHISELNKSVVNREREKQDLLLSVARLQEDVLKTSLRTGSSPDVSALVIPLEKTNAASQTDLSGESSNQFAELVRLRLQYNEAKNRMGQLQVELANIESQVIPGQIESDRDRLILIEEKEQLLRELRCLNLRGRTKEDVNYIQRRVQELERDLKQELDEASRQMAFKNLRLELNRAKCDILQNLAETAKIITQLEIKIKTLSLSTTSISSGSSLGSLGSLSASSKGSQNSMALSLTDVYSMQAQVTADVNLPELRLRVERLLQGHRDTILEDVVSSAPSDIPCGFSSDIMSCHQTEHPQIMLEPCSLPSYEEHMERQRLQNFAASPDHFSYICQNMTANSMLPAGNQSLHDLQPGAGLGLPTDLDLVACLDGGQNIRHHQLDAAAFNDNFIDKVEKTSNPPLSPISESSSGVYNGVLYYNGNLQSVSAAMSDDSITGGSDSGVSESNMIYRPRETEGCVGLNGESAQVQIKIQYIWPTSTLEIRIEQAKNLSALFMSELPCKMYFRVSLLPSSDNSLLQMTQPREFSSDPIFNSVFPFAVSEDKLLSKTVQINLYCADNSLEDMCCGVVLISLASFDLSAESIHWYNILNLNFMGMELEENANLLHILKPLSGTSDELHHQSFMLSRNEFSTGTTLDDNVAESLPKSSRSSSVCHKESSQTTCPAVLPVKEESSDESTVISSQTSTLTRNHKSEDLEEQKGGKDDDELRQYCALMSASVAGTFETTEAGSVDECGEDDDELEDNYERLQHLKKELCKLNAEKSKWSYPAQGIPACQGKMFNYSDSSIRGMKCDKETNTDFSSSQMTGKLSRQSHDMNRGSTIRRWQTFSPTAAGTTDEELGCKLSRSGSDSSVRNRRNHFERHAFERQSVRLKKSSLSTAKPSVPCDKTKNRTSIDLELDLQAHRVQLAHLNEEIFSLKELKRRLEESKEKGENEPTWLMENEQLQQFLTQAEKMLPRHERRQNMSNIDELTQRRMRKAKKEVQKLQSTNQHTQSNELSFRKKMAFFTTMSSIVPIINRDNMTAGSEMIDSTSATGPCNVGEFIGQSDECRQSSDAYDGYRGSEDSCLLMTKLRKQMTDTKIYDNAPGEMPGK